MSEQAEVTVESCRKELRGALLHISIFATGFAIEEREREAWGMKEMMNALITFGANSGLISMDEYKDWDGVIRGTEVCGKVLEKWETSCP